MDYYLDTPPTNPCSYLLNQSHQTPESYDAYVQCMINTGQRDRVCSTGYSYVSQQDANAYFGYETSYREPYCRYDSGNAAQPLTLARVAVRNAYGPHPDPQDYKGLLILLGVVGLIAAPIAGGIALGSAAFALGALAWEAGYFAYNYGPKSEDENLNNLVDTLAIFTNWENVKWATDAVRCTGDAGQFVAATVNAALGINLFQAFAQFGINAATLAGEGTLTLESLKALAARIARRNSVNAPEIVIDGSLQYAGYHMLGKLSLKELGKQSLSVLRHEMTHLIQYGRAGTQWEQSLVSGLTAASNAGSKGILPLYFLNPMELQAFA